MEESFKRIKLFVKDNLLIISIIMLIAMLILYKGLIKEITIIDGEKEIQLNIACINVEDVLKKNDMQVRSFDKVYPNQKTRVEDGMEIKITRAHPVYIKADGMTKRVMTVNTKVEDILNQYNIIIGENDVLSPQANEEVGINEYINVHKITQKKITENEVIPYNTVVKCNGNLEVSQVNVLQKGNNGEKKIDFLVTYKDNEIISKEEINEEIIKNPVDEIVEKGTCEYIATARGTLKAKKAYIMKATAYDLSYASCGKTPDNPNYGITYTGTRASAGTVAVDPKVIKLGSKLYIESLDGSEDYGFARAEDIGSAVKGNKIDLFIEDHKNAMAFGVKKVKVYVID